MQGGFVHIHYMFLGLCAVIVIVALCIQRRPITIHAVAKKVLSSELRIKGRSKDYDTDGHIRCELSGEGIEISYRLTGFIAPVIETIRCRLRGYDGELEITFTNEHVTLWTETSSAQILSSYSTVVRNNQELAATVLRRIRAIAND